MASQMEGEGLLVAFSHIPRGNSPTFFCGQNFFFSALRLFSFLTKHKKIIKKRGIGTY